MQVPRPGSDSLAIADGRTVHVIATSLEGTRDALEAASALARGVSGNVLLFVHRPAPDLARLDHDSEEADRITEVTRLAESYKPRPKVLTCTCERATDVIQLFQLPGLVVLGGETRWWWPTPEQRLARALTRLGCHVTFVHVTRSRFVSPLSRIGCLEGRRLNGGRDEVQSVVRRGAEHMRG